MGNPGSIDADDTKTSCGSACVSGNRHQVNSMKQALVYTIFIATLTASSVCAAQSSGTLGGSTQHAGDGILGPLIDLGVLIGFVTLILFILGLVFAFFGRPWFESAIDKHMDKSMVIVQRDAMAGVTGIVGLLYYELREIDQRFLDDAINYSRRSYQAFSKDHQYRTISMNNFAFLCAVKGDTDHAPVVVELALELRRKVSETGEIEHLTTFAAVVVAFYKYFPDPRLALADAIRTMRRIIRNLDISQRHRHNAATHLVRLRKTSSDLRQETKGGVKV